MKRIVVAAVLVLGSLSAVGACAQTSDAGTAPRHFHQKHDPHKQAMHLGKRLGLTTDQTTRLEPILAQHRQQADAIRQNAELSPDQKRSQMHELKRSTQQQLSSVLTPEQLQQWKQMRRQHHGKADNAAPTGV